MVDLKLLYRDGECLLNSRMSLVGEKRTSTFFKTVQARRAIIERGCHTPLLPIPPKHSSTVFNTGLCRDARDAFSPHVVLSEE
jgi:hypothetical protein